MFVPRRLIPADYRRPQGKVKSSLLPGRCVRLSRGGLGLSLGNHYRARAPHLDEFCQEADGDLLGRAGMNVEANRRMYPIQPLPRNALGFEELPDLGNPGLAAEHAQVAGWTIVDLLQDGMVVRMASGHQYNIVVL